MHHEQHLGEAGRREIRRVARRVISRRFYTASTDDGSSSDSDTNPPPSIPRLSRCGDRAHVDFLKIDIDLKWDSIGRGFRDIVNSSAWHVRGCVALAMGFPAHHPVAVTVAHAMALSMDVFCPQWPSLKPEPPWYHWHFATCMNTYQLVPACTVVQAGTTVPWYRYQGNARY